MLVLTRSPVAPTCDGVSESSPHPNVPRDELLACLETADVFELFEPVELQLLEKHLQRVTLSEGDIVFHEGDESDALYVVRTGRLEVSVAQEGRAPLVVAEVGPGTTVGEVQAVMAGQRTATVRAVTPAELVRIPNVPFQRALERSPHMTRHLTRTVRRRLRSNQLTRLLPRLFGPVDHDLVDKVQAQGAWIDLHRGEALFHQNDQDDHLYLVISGRLVAVATDAAGEKHVLGEIPAGEPVGEMALFTGEARSASVYALRDSVLVRFSKPFFDEIAEEHPSIMMKMTRLLIRRLRSTIEVSPRQDREQNIALLPAGPQVPLAAFAQRLHRQLSRFGATYRLDSKRVDVLLGTPGIAQARHSDAAYLRLATSLDDQEDKYRFVLYEADPSPTTWTRRCIRRADHVVIVAEAGADPTPGAVEALMEPEGDHVAARSTLVLIHPDGQRLPRGTRRWLAPRRVHQHHHVRWDRDDDVGRLARFLSGRAVGLVLSGGGARGFAHIGLIQALREHGVPIDMVAGTSMGAIVGAQSGLGFDRDAMIDACRATFVTPRPFRKYTLPYIALLRHDVFDGSAKRTYGEAHLEDLWHPCLCVSSNLSTAELVVRRTGPVSDAILASSALPGIVAPRVQDGHLLVDGGVLNNIPSDVIKQYCGAVVVSDVTEGQTIEVGFDAFPSPWKLLWRRLSPFHEEIRTPKLMSILMRTAVLGSVKHGSTASTGVDLYLRMPVDDYGMLQMDRLEEIAEVGYRHSRDVLERGREAPWYAHIRATGASETARSLP